MEYAIKEIARVIGAKTNQLLDDTVSLLLTDSRRLLRLENQDERRT